MPFDSSQLENKIVPQSQRRTLSFTAFAVGVKRIPLALAFNIVAIALFVLVGFLRVHYGKVVFWDAHVYSRGIEAYLAGSNPYLHIYKLNFVYPPLFLKLGALTFDFFPLKATAYLYLSLHCIAVLSVPFLLVRAWMRIPWLPASLALAVFLCQPGMVAEQALFSGNISGILYAAALIAGIPGIRKNRWTWFYLVILSGSLIKIPFASLLLLPLLLGEGQLLQCTMSAAVVLLGALLQRVAWPDLYRDYVDAVRFQVINRADYGFGIVGISRLYHLGSHVPILHDNIGYVLHVVLVGALIIGLCIIRRVRRGKLSGDMWNAAVLLTALLINPRLKPYDVDIVVIPALVLVVEGFRAALRQRVQLFLTVLPPLSYAVLLTLDPIAGIFSSLVAALVFFIMTERFGSHLHTDASRPLSSVDAMNWIGRGPARETTA